MESGFCCLAISWSLGRECVVYKTFLGDFFSESCLLYLLLTFHNLPTVTPYLITEALNTPLTKHPIYPIRVHCYHSLSPLIVAIYTAYITGATLQHIPHSLIKDTIRSLMFNSNLTPLNKSMASIVIIDNYH